MKTKISKKYALVLTIIGVAILLLVAIGGTYAYFSIQSGASSNTMIFTGKVQNSGIVTGEKGVETAIINLSNIDMSSENTGKYYATSEIENNYNKEEEILNVFKATSSNVLTNEVYTCTFNLKLNVTGTEKFEEKDAMLKISGTGSEEVDTTYDLSKTSEFNHELTWKFIGNESKEINISAYIENKENQEQNESLSNTNMNIDVTVENFSCDLRVDTKAPEEFTFYLGGEENPRYTTKTELEPYLAWEDTDIEYYCLIDEIDSGSCKWIKVSGNSVKASYVLSEGDGEKTVYAFIKDEVGNISPSVKSTITLLTNPPTDNSVIINNNATYTTSNEITLSMLSNGASEMCISETENCTNWESYAEEKTYTLSSELGLKTIYVKFRDPALNETEFIKSTIMLYEEVEKVPTVEGSLTYTGSSQSPTWNDYDSSKLTIGGTTSAVNAGTYSATFTPKTNYVWSDGTSIAKTVSWGIGITTGEVTLDSEEGTITYPSTTTFNVTNNKSNGTLSVTSSNTSVATVSINGNVVTVTSGTQEGTSLITVTSAKTNNHTEASTTYKITVKNGTLDVKSEGYTGTYDGNAHGITVTNTNGGTVTYSTSLTGTYSSTKPTYTNAGTYTTYYKVEKAGYVTVTGSKTVTITQATGTLSLSAASGTITYPNAGSFTMSTNSTSGSVSVSSNNPSVATASRNGNAITINPGTTAGSATITVTVAETTNYTAVSKTYTVTVNAGTLNVTASNYTGTYDGNAHGITVTNANGGTVTYSTSLTGTYSTTNPTYTNAGTYTVYYIVSKAGYTTAAGSATVTINKASGSVSLSASSLSMKVNNSSSFTVTRIGNGSISVSSSNTSVATVSVSGTTVTVTGKGAGSATITVNVAAGTNHKAVSKTINVTVTEASLSSYLINNVSSSILWNSTLEGDGYRYVGANPNNYICFGTSDKNTCTGDTDKYMYRIIGIFEDENGNNHLKLIKNTETSSEVWGPGWDKRIWSDSYIFSNINGSKFLTNTSYSYMQNDTWLNMISTWNYTQAISYSDSEGSISYEYDTNASEEEIYLHELNRSTKTNNIGEWSTVSAKIGLMYVSDVMLARSNGNWMERTGWTMSCAGWGDDEGDNQWMVWEWSAGNGSSHSEVSHYPLSVYPVFYLEPTVSYSSGSGTLSDQYMLSS